MNTLKVISDSQATNTGGFIAALSHHPVQHWCEYSSELSHSLTDASFSRLKYEKNYQNHYYLEPSVGCGVTVLAYHASDRVSHT